MLQLRRYLAQPVGNAPLVVWRVAFGLLMLLESWGAIATGWVRANVASPDYTFPFLGFDWLGHLGGPVAYVYFAVMGAAAAGVMLGYRYRLSATALALLWAGAYLSQKTSYNNHYYLAVLLCGAMVLTPDAAERASLDARRRGSTRLAHPRWITLGAKLMLLIVFSYGAVAKLYPGWLNGDFVRVGFGGKAHFWLIGDLLQEPLFQSFITYGALAFDAAIIPLLWWRPTRRLAWFGLLAFNVFNSAVFHIGIFPYLVLAFTVFFFDPAQVERWFRLPPKPAAGALPGGQDVLATAPPQAPAQPMPVLATAAFGLFFAVQALLPLRHHLFPGDVNWTEEGHRLSWRMMTRSKSGSVTLEARNPATDQRERVPSGLGLSPKQRSQVATKPDFLYQWVQRLREHYRDERGWPTVELYVTESEVYLNGRGPYPLFAPGVDLAAAQWNYTGHQPWVLDAPPDLYE